MESKDLQSKCNLEYYEFNPMIQRSCVCMSQHFVANSMAGFEHNVSNEDFMEHVARDECLHNRKGKDF